MEKYRQYYLERLESGKAADRTNCPYNEKDYLLDDRKIIDSILKNPFEKFERKRFMSYAKDLSKISLHHRLWEHLKDKQNIERLRAKMIADMENYFEQIE